MFVWHIVVIMARSIRLSFLLDVRRILPSISSDDIVVLFDGADLFAIRLVVLVLILRVYVIRPV